MTCAAVCWRMWLNVSGYLEEYLEVAVVKLRTVVFSTEELKCRDKLSSQFQNAKNQNDLLDVSTNPLIRCGWLMWGSLS